MFSVRRLDGSTSSGVKLASPPPPPPLLPHAQAVRCNTMNMQFRARRTYTQIYQQPDEEALQRGKQKIREKIASRNQNHPLPREWYCSQEVFDIDVKYLWKKQWLFAAYECQIPSVGDYVTFQVQNENVIIIRSSENKLNAFYNVCRHRGARLCPTDSGTVKNITCPYHSWTYDKTGNLIKANHMEGLIDFSDYSLIPCNIRTVGGLIFINFSKIPVYSFEPAAELFQHQLKHHHLENAKVCYSRSDIVKANWKLVYENNRECYHCPNAHPEYIKANYDLMFSYIQKPDGSYVREVDPNHPKKQEAEAHVEESNKRWAKYDLECAVSNIFPGDGWYRASRMPLKKGWVTESIDGTAVAPILGDFQEADRDMGSLRIHCLPNYWVHVSSDHAVSSTLIPIDPLHTRVDQHWLVHKDAQEGKDYDLSKLTPFWERTNLSDWEICEYNQAGVLSDAYKPMAPYSLKKEGGVENFVRWYTTTLLRGMDM